MAQIQVYSAYKLAPSDLQVCAEIARKDLKMTGKLTNIIDKSVIAGVKITAEGRQLDLTLSGSLLRLAGTLT